MTFGFWSIFQRPERLVNPRWSPVVRTRVLKFVRTGYTDKTAYMGYSWCRFGCFESKSDPRMGCSDYFDELWCWPEGLHHYLEQHLVMPPPAFILHALRKTPPAALEVK